LKRKEGNFMGYKFEFDPKKKVEIAGFEHIHLH
jgi:hypothetical protein